ncbi:MAG: hypothetical protein QOC81_964, partial [Thermoanaerobaculia bacterium]|nr:hypothetical protein [Thermoanaerobaculia bacterium]
MAGFAGRTSRRSKQNAPYCGLARGFPFASRDDGTHRRGQGCWRETAAMHRGSTLGRLQLPTMSDELTYDMTCSPLATRGVYHPLRFRIGPPDKARVRATASMILESYYKDPMTFTRWRAAEWLVFRWKRDDAWQISRPFRWQSICDYLAEHQQFAPSHFNFPDLLSSWLDSSVAAAPQFHAPANEKLDEALTFVFPTALSESFPIRPQHDREGRAFSSLQLMLLQSWLELRTRLVDQSHLMFDGHEWLRDLFAYFSTIVAAVDNTLHQVYYRAKYEAARHGWKFDAEALGPTHGQSMQKKLRWIGQITSRPLEKCAG